MHMDYGLRDSIIRWIKKILNARNYRVKVNLRSSRWCDVTSGIPQVDLGVDFKSRLKST